MTSQCVGKFNPEKINYDPGLIQLLVECAIDAMEETTYYDGDATLSTRATEALERALHNVYQPYRPSYPDSHTSVACIYGCRWCKENDAARED